MGFTPQEIDRMSIWQYAATIDGFNAAHDPDAGKALSEAERDDLWEWMQGKPN